jgi:8-hydroxy-5-deazaflavin:NADPH oxidoreductase
MRIAVLGAGHTGPIIARMGVETGHQVSLSASGDPKKIALITQVLVPGAEPRWSAEAVREADIVVLAMPLHAFAKLDPAMFDGKLVIDIMNYWPPTDGDQPLFDVAGRGSSEIVAERLRGATVVKTLNHIGYHDMDDRRRPPGAPDRLALGVAGDDPAAVATVAALVDSFGYEPVVYDSLAAGRDFEPGSPVFGALLTRDEFLAALTPAERAA